MAVKAYPPRETPRGDDYTGIGTLSEKTLHAELKRRLEPDESRHEQKVEGTGYIADILEPDGRIYEIQTRGFSRLKKKLPALLERHPVTVVYPAVRKKWLCWLDDGTGEVTPPRKSPKTGTFYEIFYELRWIRPLLDAPGLDFLLIPVDVEEYRHRDGWSRDGKKGSTRAERIPVGYGEEALCGGVYGWSALIPAGLPEPFTAKDYRLAAGISEKLAGHALYLLRAAGAVQEAGRRGSAKLYAVTETGR